MPIDFFTTPCNNQRGNCITEDIKCLQDITHNIFGISDADGGGGLPAKVTTTPNEKEDFIVNNNSNTKVRFKAIDWCIPIYRTGVYDLNNDYRIAEEFHSDVNGERLIKRCEGFFHFDDSIVFIEIKNRRTRSWLKDSREKFEETILSFREHHPELADRVVEPILSNPCFHGVHQNMMLQQRVLKDKIGLEFLILNKISI